MNEKKILTVFTTFLLAIIFIAATTKKSADTPLAGWKFYFLVIKTTETIILKGWQIYSPRIF
jgi:hypothetical protein